MAGEIIQYQTEDGVTVIRLQATDGSVWLSQADMAELFQTTKQSVSLHIRNILDEGELDEAATVKENLTVQSEGNRQVSRQILLYNLQMILAVGFRVRSLRGMQFRRWAAASLSEYLVKGFVMDDARLKDPETDYFEELLARIRDIRASEKLFYKKVLDIYATAVDYDPRAEASQQFFQTVQNKMHHAAHGQTAAETKVARADASKPMMGITNWPGESRGQLPTRADAQVAKNYLEPEEMETLNRITVAFLEFAEAMAKNRKAMHMADWITKLDDFLKLGDHSLLAGAGRVQAKVATKKVDAEYDAWHARAINAPSTVEQHFVEAMGKAKAIEVTRPSGNRKGKED
ncbi:hydroxyacid dehydrogenase [Brevundimonas diminuta]|uniref:virulence RhuM family protein n=1 Tax=Brevundimonas diminuta TaxID=293 RepID=UPI00168ADF9B|nr:virulence RhuM family protein [Brevundimonas diminuta]MBD3572812.1 hydroxyacid dehydrogenase [Brevundimonas diminuta]